FKEQGVEIEEEECRAAPAIASKDRMVLDSGTAPEMDFAKKELEMSVTPSPLVQQAPIPAGSQPAYDAIVRLTDRFCQVRLTYEYQMLCRKLAGVLARKRPSPLIRGKTELWACAIVRVIGWVNYLDDSSQKPHMKLTAIDKAFGIGESTAQGKAKAIR